MVESWIYFYFLIIYLIIWFFNWFIRFENYNVINVILGLNKFLLNYVLVCIKVVLCNNKIFMFLEIYWSRSFEKIEVLVLCYVGLWW